MAKIEDGKGRGYIAEVNADNKLVTKSLNIPHLHKQSLDDEDAYMIHMHFAQDTGSAWEGCGYITYTGDKKLVVSKAIACNEGVATDDYYGFAFYFNPTGLANGTDFAPLNMNRTSNRTLSATVKHDNDDTSTPITTSDDGDHSLCFRLRPSSTTNIDYQDAIVLGQNDTFYVKAHAKTAGEKMRITFFVFEVD